MKKKITITHCLLLFFTSIIFSENNFSYKKSNFNLEVIKRLDIQNNNHFNTEMVVENDILILYNRANNELIVYDLKNEKTLNRFKKYGIPLVINSELLFLEDNLYIAYKFDANKNDFNKTYNKNNDFYYRDNSLFNKSNKITEVFVTLTNEGDIESLEHANYLKHINNYFFYIFINDLDNIRDLYIYNLNTDFKNVIGENIYGYIVFNENNILVNKIEETFSGHSPREFYMIDYSGNILIDMNDLKNFSFNDGVILDNERFLLLGSINKSSGIFLCKYSFDKNNELTRTNAKTSDLTSSKTQIKLRKYNLAKATVNNLRLRRSPEINDNNIIKTLKKDEYLKILAYGEETTINNIKNKWVEARTEEGIIGWCFGGYLEEIE